MKGNADFTRWARVDYYYSYYWFVKVRRSEVSIDSSGIFELLFEPLVENLYFLGYYAKECMSEYSTGNDPNQLYDLVVTVSQGSR